MRAVLALLCLLVVVQGGLITALVWAHLAPPDAATLEVDAAGAATAPSLAAAAAAWPEEQRAAEVCGTQWQEAYAALHARLVEQATRRGSAERVRLAVFDCGGGQGGYADRLTGLMTVLLLAVLTDRALVVRWAGHEAAVRWAGVDATALLGHAAAARAGERRDFRWLQGNRLELAKLTDVPDLNEAWPERVLVFSSNRGFTQHLLRSHHHSQKRAERHLTTTNAQFGCLFNFLLRPTPRAMRPYAPLLLHLSDPATYIVGLHVRTGDAAFTHPDAARGEALYARHQFMFDFARQLAARQPLPYRILLLSDSVPLRQHAAEVEGAALLSPNSTVGHVARDPRALSNAVAEHWLYAASDAFVYSSHSGFPRTAAARALRTDRIFTCFHYEGPLFSEQQGKPRPARECSGPYTVFELGDRHAAGL
ncbi:hypothetical protein AB1Y20_003594 [Prymnesium parvum]|uniref:Uncharacterized protein n=1 Tax=Prymnesium parvum TaxID=97485 RepID=A0AB34J6N0_PRYPA